MSERRCPSCGALVSDDAQWCGQCFTSLADGSEPASEVESTPPPPPAVGVEPAAAGRPSSEPTAPRDPGSLESPTKAKAAFWTCPSCGEHNEIATDICGVCGTPFSKLFEEPSAVIVVPRGRAVAWSLAFPGLGHRLLGRGAEGLARGAVFTLAIGAAAFLVLGRSGHGLGPILWILAIYGLFAIAVYAFTAVEAGRIADGGEVLVTPRAFAWVAAALVVVSLGVSIFIAVGATRGR